MHLAFLLLFAIMNGPTPSESSLLQSHRKEKVQLAIQTSIDDSHSILDRHLITLHSQSNAEFDSILAQVPGHILPLRMAHLDQHIDILDFVSSESLHSDDASTKRLIESFPGVIRIRILIASKVLTDGFCSVASKRSLLRDSESVIETSSVGHNGLPELGASDAKKPKISNSGRSTSFEPTVSMLGASSSISTDD